MKRFFLGLMLAAGLTCMLACLGSKKKDEEPAAEVQAPPKMDPRHQQRVDALADGRHRPQTERVDETPIEIKSMERVGSEAGAAMAAEEFVMRFVRLKYKARGVYDQPFMKYIAQTEEWSAYGVLQGKDPRLPRYTVECFVHFNKDNEWECRLMRIDNKQVYAMDIPDPKVKLPNIQTDRDGYPVDERDKTSVADDNDQNDSDTAETPEQAANREADGDLRMAKALINRSPAKAKQRLQKIIDKFPDTAAAEEAGKLIKTIKE